MAPRSSAKAVVCWHDRGLVDEIWVGDEKVENLPFDVPEGATVGVAIDPVLSAIRPLARNRSGAECASAFGGVRYTSFFSSFTIISVRQDVLGAGASGFFFSG